MNRWMVAFITFLVILFVIIVGCTSMTTGQPPSENTVQPSSISPQMQSSSSCFQFSNVKSTELSTLTGDLVYVLEGDVTNTCMKNIEKVCVQATFYDNANFEVASKKYFVPQLQHGTSVKFIFNNAYSAGTGTNKATRHQLEAYELASSRYPQCL
jgi:hypothetical protein